MMGLPTVMIGEAGGGGGGGMGAIPIPALVNVMNNAPQELANKIAQVVALKQAAASGTPFCEECAKV
jgi:hypothetical protein